MTDEVLIVGAGPSGLMAALVLATAGCRVRVVEQRKKPTAESRAAIVHVRTLELWDTWGVAASALACASPLSGVRVAVKGRTLTRFTLHRRAAGAANGFEHPVALSQRDTERILAEAVQERGGIIERGKTVTTVTQDTSGVTADVRDALGRTRTLRASYLIGADGATSTVRQALGIEMPRGTYPPAAFLADVELDPPPDPAVIHLNLAQGGFVGVLGLGSGLYRLFGALSPSYANTLGAPKSGGAVRQEELQRWFDEYFGIPARITRTQWSSAYRIHHGLATSLHQRRMFLIGDAAHLHAPAGGQGMNLGIGDAVNLAWKLAAVLHGETRPVLIDTFEPERRRVAEAVLRYADRGFRLEASDSPIFEFVRRNVIPVAVRLVTPTPVFRELVFRLFAQTWITYRGSPAVAGTEPRLRAGLAPGARVPPPLLPRTGSSDQAAAPHFQLLLVTDPASGADVAGVRRLVTDYISDLDVAELRTGSPAANALLGRRHTGLLLVRPDGHVAYRGTLRGETALRTYLDRWYVPNAETAGIESS